MSYFANPFFLSFCSYIFQALDAKAAAKRKAEEERIAKLSPAEQKKVINWIYVTAYLNSGYSFIIGIGKGAEASTPQVAEQSGPKVIPWY